MLTTHVGSLPRPKGLLDLMRAALNGQGDDFELAHEVRAAVADSVKQQVAHGLDVVSDGEQGKIGFFRYIGERLDGFEARPRSGASGFGPEVDDFPEYYEQYFKRAMTGGGLAPAMGLVCVGPVTYRGQAALQNDIDNLKAATRSSNQTEVFMPSVAPSGVGRNEYYDSDEAYFLPSPMPYTPSTGPSSTPVLSCRSTTRGSPSCTATRACPRTSAAPRARCTCRR